MLNTNIRRSNNNTQYLPIILQNLYWVILWDDVCVFISWELLNHEKISSDRNNYLEQDNLQYQFYKYCNILQSQSIGLYRRKNTNSKRRGPGEAGVTCYFIEYYR